MGADRMRAGTTTSEAIRRGNHEVCAIYRHDETVRRASSMADLSIQCGDLAFSGLVAGPAAHRGDAARRHLPSHAWGEIAVFTLARASQSIIADLVQHKRCALELDDTALDLTLTDLWVTARYDLAASETGHALFAEFEAALTSFSQRLQQDFVATCPRLREHMLYRSWFR
jgi:hypothetical protein